MKVYFLTRQPDVCQLIADKFVQQGHIVKIYPLVSKFAHQVFELNQKPDVLFLDYFYILIENSNPYDVLIKQNTVFPIVFYNHPFPSAEKRKFFWNKVLQTSGLFGPLNFLSPVLEIMDNALKDPKIMPYVEGIQPAKPFRSGDLRYIEPIADSEVHYYTKTFDNTITDKLLNKKTQVTKISEPSTEYKTNTQNSNFLNIFKVKNRISAKLFVLFCIFYKNLDKKLSLEELKKHLDSEKDDCSINSIRLRVHRLRAIVQNDVDSHLEIITLNQSYMMVRNN